MMETYLPSAFDFLYWKEMKKNFLAPKCIEINITGRNNSANYNHNEIDIFTLERILEELKNLKIEWLVFGRKNEIFLHKSIGLFFKLIKKFNLKIYSLKTNGVYLDRVDMRTIFNLVKKNLFIKKEKNFKSYQNELFKENLIKIMSYFNKNNLVKPDIYLFEEDFEKYELNELQNNGFKFLKTFSFCQPELIKYLPFFFLSIDNNGFCFSSENNLRPVSTIFFNSIKKIWLSKRMKRIRKNIIAENKIEFFSQNLNNFSNI